MKAIIMALGFLIAAGDASAGPAQKLFPNAGHLDSFDVGPLLDGLRAGRAEKRAREQHKMSLAIQRQQLLLMQQQQRLMQQQNTAPIQELPPLY